MKLWVYVLEEITDASGRISEETAAEMMRQRRNGDMVLLCSAYCRTVLMQKYYAYANCFIADGGMFAFSGCHSLYHDFYSEEEISFLLSAVRNSGGKCAFYEETDQACGGYIIVHGPKEPHSYALNVSGADQVRLRAELNGRFDVYEGKDGMYVLRHQMSYERALQAVVRYLNLTDSDVIVKGDLQ